MRRAAVATLGLGSLLACNLSGGTPTPMRFLPTVAPIVPTIGYATVDPARLPSQDGRPPPPSLHILNILNQVANDRLLLHVDALAGFGTRHFNSGYEREGWGIGAAFRYVRGEMEAIAATEANVRVFAQEFEANFNGVSALAHNVIATIPGREPAAGTVVVGAHYDSISLAINDEDSPAPGANDNASGVAALLEIARILAPLQPRATVMLVAFGAEEVGRLGSLAFVNEIIRGREIDVIAMINLDIIGSSTAANGAINDSELRIFSHEDDQSVARQLARAVDMIGFHLTPTMDLQVQNAADRTGRFSDHLSFTEAGYPAVRLIEAFEERNRQHTAQDTIEDISPLYLQRTTEAALAITLALVDGPRPPRLERITLRPLEDGRSRLVWEPTEGAVRYYVHLRQEGIRNYHRIFSVTENSVEWDEWGRYAGLAIAAVDERGLIGPLSAEFRNGS
ncbi:MAG: M20/M25/M40 family metallo-hydrolase [Anaerolineaceae bacterium]|nr:M20/M25/M40 family metallo-hydrolase [Anaerolineaceae bacterium]